MITTAVILAWSVVVVVVGVLFIITIPIMLTKTLTRATPGCSYWIGDHERTLDPTITLSGHVMLTRGDFLGKLLDLYRSVAPILTKHKVTFWACSGTLIGAMRHKGIIPWDDDIDLAIPMEAFPQFIAASREMKQNGINIKYIPFYDTNIVKLFWPGQLQFIDILFVKRADQEYRFCSPNFKSNGECSWVTHNLWKNETFPVDMLYPLREQPFEDTTIPVPAQAVRILKQQFSDKVMTHGIGTLDVGHYLDVYIQPMYKHLLDSPFCRDMMTLG